MATITSSQTILVDDEVKSQAQKFNTALQNRPVSQVSVSLDDHVTLALPASLADLLVKVLNSAAQGSTRIVTIPQELTTTVAAELLSVSRPTLMKWVKEGRVASHRVGSHHRFKRDDILALARDRRAEQKAAFDAIREIDEQLEDTN